MSRFLQIHLLTPYHPSNLNRDDLGRPKTAMIGGKQRLRISSQSLKRAWRTSGVFQDAFEEQMGTRTKEMGRKIAGLLEARGVSPENAEEWAARIGGVFGKNKKNEPLETEQLVHFSPQEEKAIQELVERLAASGEAPADEDLKLLRLPETAVDIALFGRMLAANPAYNMEAALQVAHAFTVNESPVEDDFFTAVDDLNQGIEDVGAGHMGETGFGAGVFYAYLCLDCGLLTENLGGDSLLAKKAGRALVEAAAMVAPTGKQNSFASRSVAHYALAEYGQRQPRSLASAFIAPVRGSKNQLETAVDRLEEMRGKLDKVYGPMSESSMAMNALTGSGSLAAVQDFVEGCI